jgi:hypothetical protein
MRGFGVNPFSGGPVASYGFDPKSTCNLQNRPSPIAAQVLDRRTLEAA